MKATFLKVALMGFAVTAITATSCTKTGSEPVKEDDNTRWITVSGALMKTTAGDGNGGGRVFSLTVEDAKNPNFEVNVFDGGAEIKSERTARLQATSDGKYLFNIQYTGDDGGVFQKYRVLGGNRISPEGPQVATADYVSKSPRWLKVSDDVGVGVRAEAEASEYTGTFPNLTYVETIAKTDVITLDLKDPKITKTNSFDLKLSPEEVAAGYYVFRIDMPVLNKARNKVFIGVATSKKNTTSPTVDDKGVVSYPVDRNAPRIGAKTLVLDYPSLANPKLITSTKTKGSTNGYRAPMQYLGTDGHVYQATSGETAGTGGSRILRINSETNEYDNTFEFNLDKALGITDSYIETWLYTGGGKGFVVYKIAGKGGYFAKIDLNAGTAKKYNLPNEDKLRFGQIQHVGMEGNDVFLAVAPVGENGNIYVFDKNSDKMEKGAKLINKTGNQYIGIY